MPISITPRYAKYLLQTYKPALEEFSKNATDSKDTYFIKKLKEIAENHSKKPILLIDDIQILHRLAEKYLSKSSRKQDFLDFIDTLEHPKILLRKSMEGLKVKLAIDCPTRDIRNNFVNALISKMKAESPKLLSDQDIQKWLEYYSHEGDNSFYIPALIMSSGQLAVSFFHNNVKSLFLNLTNLLLEVEPRALSNTVGILLLFKTMVIENNQILGKPIHPTLQVPKEEKEQKKSIVGKKEKSSVVLVTDEPKSIDQIFKDRFYEALKEAENEDILITLKFKNYLEASGLVHYLCGKLDISIKPIIGSKFEVSFLPKEIDRLKMIFNPINEVPIDAPVPSINPINKMPIDKTILSIEDMLFIGNSAMLQAQWLLDSNSVDKTEIPSSALLPIPQSTEPNIKTKSTVVSAEEKLPLVFRKSKEDAKNADNEKANLKAFYDHFMTSPVFDKTLYYFYFSSIEMPFIEDYFSLVTAILKVTKHPLEIGYGPGKANINEKFKQPEGVKYAARFILLEDQFKLLKEIIEIRIGLKPAAEVLSSEKEYGSFGKFVSGFFYPIDTTVVSSISSTSNSSSSSSNSNNSTSSKGSHVSF